MCHAVIAETNTQRAMCQRVSNFFFLQRYTSSYMYMYLHTIMKHQRKHCMVSNEKKNALHVGYYWLWKKIDITDFFSNFQKLLHVSCTLILLKQKQLISKRISIVQLCFTDLSNNLFKVCLMPIHCAVFMRDLRIFSFSFYLDWKPVWAVFLKILFATKTCYM